MIPDPPAPLHILPSVDHLEVVVPRGSGWRRAVAFTVAGTVGLSLLAILGFVCLSVAAAALGSGALLLGAMVAAVTAGGPALVLFVMLLALLRADSTVISADRRGVRIGSDLVLWEGIDEFRADGDVVALMMDDGTWMDVAAELPQAAAWWLAAALAHLHAQAQEDPIDGNGLAAVRRTRDQQDTPAKDAPVVVAVPSPSTAS